MKKIVISTRFFPFDWYQETFLNYYLKAGAYQIRVYCHSEDEETISTLIQSGQNSPRVKLIPILNRRLCSFDAEWEICRMIYKDTLFSLKKGVRSGEQYMVAFPDHDEFIEITPQAFEFDLCRTVFYEWYLSPEACSGSITAQEMLKLAIIGKLKGRILEMWDDPFYKDYVINLCPENYDFFCNMDIMGGFHRLLKNKMVYHPDQFHTLKVHHLKGIPDHVRKPLFAYRTKETSRTKDDWVAWHFNYESERLLGNYKNSYRELGSRDEIEALVKRLVSDYEPEKSIYEQVIIPQNLGFPGYSRPSLVHDCPDPHPLIQEFLWKKKDQQ